MMLLTVLKSEMLVLSKMLVDC